LQLANGFNLNSGRVITLNAGGGAIDTQTFNSTISQVIGGAGGLTKLGSGTLTLSGTNTYTGASSVNAGTLLVTGSSASSAITVASGGTLGGTGRVGATTVSAGGTLAPGVGGVGTLGVNGALSFAAGSTAAFDITPTAADKITATGSASLAGTLALSPIAGAYTVGTDLQLISAASVSGTFTNVTGNSFTGLNSTIVYSATGVDLVLGSAGPTMFLFGTYGKTPNEVAAGEALAASPATSPLYLALGSIVTANTPAVATALNELAGEIHASLRSAAVQDSRIIRDTILGRMSLAPTGTQVWGAGFGGWGSIGSNGNASGFGHHADGLLVGVDTDIAPTLRGGVAGAYSENYLSLRNNDGSAYGNVGRVIFYLDWDAGDSFDVKVGADYGGGTNRVSRPVVALSETEHDHEHLTIGQIFGDIGYKLPTAYAFFEPYADVNYVSVKSGGFDESGGIAALSGRRVEDNETYSTFGIRASGNAIHWDMMALTPRIEFGWEHAYNRFNPSQVMTFQSTAESFMVQGAPLERDTAVIGAGFDLAILPDVLLSLGYNGAFSSKVSYNAVRGGLQWKL
jgi:outer membrane autotransporter protein